MSLRSSSFSARQYCAILKVMFAPTVAGQSTLVVVSPAFVAASQSVGTLMSSAYQYQPPRFLLNGLSGGCGVLPCPAGFPPRPFSVFLDPLRGGGTPGTRFAGAPPATS